ncbi:hypothetical protein L1987_08886 [Smallanthus sonchifolius]|uniref:Uncharacterized protein n=1 Tax=Smallanthus sonchifolius TaxID=185202 RepID=A0ACB9JNK1_9ASTR|nr:hypothetical protein L1987_08886 [Smallanthus sonchifolius]
MPAPFHHHRNTTTVFFFFFLFHLFFPVHALTPGSSLSVENTDDILLSPNGLFTAGFLKVGDNAYCFAIWFSTTVVWMAKRDQPVNGIHSKLSLRKDGNLVLTDAGQYNIWSTQTKSNSSLHLQLHNTGNLILHERGNPIWQSFDHPADTLLPNQQLTKNTQLVSSRSSTNYSSGFYKLLFDSPEATTIFWPDPGLLPWQVGRFQYSYTLRARMMKIDVDGNLRVYSLVEQEWVVQWQAMSHPCRIHGLCGQNSLCTYSVDSGKICTCLHGYKMVNPKDWSYGCEPDFKICRPEDEDFIELRYAEFYSYDIRYHENYSLDACKNDCLHDCTCKGFQFGSDDEVGTYYCYIKTSLYNGYQMGFYNSMYIKLPKTFVSSFHQKPMNKSSFHCSDPTVTPSIRSYEKEQDNKVLRFLFVVGCMVRFIEIICIVFFWIKTRKSSVIMDQSYSPAATPFRKFTYRELKQASCNFSDEIGRDGASVVYKGSYGVVVLEMITGRGPGGKKQTTDENGETEPGVVEWVRDHVRDLDGSGSRCWVEDIVNGSISGGFDRTGMENLVRMHCGMENLVRVALQCAEDDMEVRPTMSQVVHMLLHPEND